MYKHRLDLVTAPTIEPVTIRQAKDHLRITESDDDDLLKNLITVARTSAETFTRRSFITQTWKMFLDQFPEKKNNQWWSGTKELPISVLTGVGSFELPKAPLQSVTHIKTYDDSDSATTFSSSNYQVSAYSGDFAEAGKITLRDGQSFPIFERNTDGIEIQFICGYGSAITSVPMQIKQALLQEIAFLYENRSECGSGINSGIARNLLEPFKIYRL